MEGTGSKLKVEGTGSKLKVEGTEGGGYWR